MNVFGTCFDYQGRLAKVRRLMVKYSLDAILVQLWPNQYYISGHFQHSPWYPIEVVSHTETPLILFRDEEKEPVFLTTYLAGNGLREATWISDVRFVDKEPYAKQPWFAYVAEALREKGVADGTIGIEKNACVLSTFEKLKSVLPNARFTAADELFENARLVKEPEELTLIKEAVVIAEAGIEAGMKAAQVGVLESEVQKVAEIEMKRLGGIREIETMCLSGRRTANHRGFGANWKRIEENDLVTLDIGCVYKGYGSDLTRTCVVGKPTALQQKVADDMISMREKILERMKPGITVGEIYDFGSIELAEEGYATDNTVFPSNEVGWRIVTIHGIGLGPMHDRPHVRDLDTKLESGMTLAVTCGARFKDCTLRWEDDVVVLPEGIELINKGLPWGL